MLARLIGTIDHQSCRKAWEAILGRAFRIHPTRLAALKEKATGNSTSHWWQTPKSVDLTFTTQTLDMQVLRPFRITTKCQTCHRCFTSTPTRRWIESNSPSALETSTRSVIFPDTCFLAMSPRSHDPRLKATCTPTFKRSSTLS